METLTMPDSPLSSLLAQIGWSQATLAHRLDASADMVRKWCAGERHTPQPVLDYAAHVAALQNLVSPPQWRTISLKKIDKARM